MSLAAQVQWLGGTNAGHAAFTAPTSFLAGDLDLGRCARRAANSRLGALVGA